MEQQDEEDGDAAQALEVGAEAVRRRGLGR